MAAVFRVTVHHEGAGSPSDNVDRFSEGGYCCGIGVTLWKRFRAPVDNWATAYFNHKDLTICLSGNRMIHEVTDNDLKLIHDAFMDFYHRGEVVAEPEVVAHRNSQGSSTACPGDKAMDRWVAIEKACRASIPTPPPTPTPTPRRRLLTTVAFPYSGTGRRPSARPIPEFNNIVLLENGARLKGDKAVGMNHTWIHPAAEKMPKHDLIDIAPTPINRNNALSGQVVFTALYDIGDPNGPGTYDAQIL